MLANFFNKIIVVSRYKVRNSQRRICATATVDGTYQNIDNQDSGVLEGVAGKTYKAWFEIGQDVQVGDILTDSVSRKRFRVIAIDEVGDGYGLEVEHLEVIMERYDN